MGIFDGTFGTPEAAARRGGLNSNKPYTAGVSAQDELDLQAALEEEAATRGQGGSAFDGVTPIPGVKPSESRRSQALNRAREFMIPRESGGNYGATNQLGYQGAYQFGRDALVDLGYVRKDAPRNNEALNDPKNWTGQNGINSLADFKTNKDQQDYAFTDYGTRNLDALEKRKVIRDDSSIGDMAGYLGVAHGYGAGNAANLALRGVDTTDANGSGAASLYKQISGNQPPQAAPQAVSVAARPPVQSLNEGPALSAAPSPDQPNSGLDIQSMIKDLYGQPRPERREGLDSGVADAMIALGSGMIRGDFGGGAVAASDVLNTAKLRRLKLAQEDEQQEFTRKQNLLTLAINAQNADTNVARVAATAAGAGTRSETDIAKRYNKEIASLPDKVTEYDRTLSNLDTLDTLLTKGNVNTGPIMGSGIGQMGQRILGNSADVENFNQITSELALAGRSLLQGSGAISNYEQSLVSNMKPSATYDEQTNKDIVARMRYATNLAKEKAAMRQGILRNGWTPEGEDEFTRQWGTRVREIEKERPLSAFGIKPEGESGSNGQTSAYPPNWDKY